jgi:hypothetical protein
VLSSKKLAKTRIRTLAGQLKSQDITMMWDATLQEFEKTGKSNKRSF